MLFFFFLNIKTMLLVANSCNNVYKVLNSYICQMKVLDM